MKVYGVPPNHYSVHMELEEIEAKLQEETNKGGPFTEWYKMFFAPRMAYRIALGMGLQMFQRETVIVCGRVTGRKCGLRFPTLIGDIGW